MSSFAKQGRYSNWKCPRARRFIVKGSVL